MVVLKDQPCARCCASMESKVGAMGRRGSGELKAEREHSVEMKAPVGVGVMHSPLGAVSQSWTDG